MSAPRACGVALLALAGCALDASVATTGPQFRTRAAGAALPDDATCAALVRPTPEARPGNAAANLVVPTAAQLAGLSPWNSENAYDNRALALEARITGAFTGTTDEILQWVACKWGFDEDDVRAEAVESSRWTQTLDTDWTTEPTSECPPDADTRAVAGGTQCAQTYGMYQVVWQYHKSAWPMYRDSTPFHVDYVYALRRACYEGWDTSQIARATSSPPFTVGDEWGCMGAHFSGGWYDAGAMRYIAAVKGQLADRAWTGPGF
ncbi:MAG TPA: hypothetical protein VH560_19835 [Polyangia bacterium]|jgi:autotransporter family porin|nr:hypothetical protein [Polyangia bacterium]